MILLYSHIYIKNGHILVAPWSHLQFFVFGWDLFSSSKYTLHVIFFISYMQVTFMLTEVVVGIKRSVRSTPRSITASEAQLYRLLAKASGGQVIEVKKSELTSATSVIEDLSANWCPHYDAWVLLHTVRTYIKYIFIHTVYSCMAHDIIFTYIYGRYYTLLNCINILYFSL